MQRNSGGNKFHYAHSFSNARKNYADFPRSPHFPSEGVMRAYVPEFWYGGGAGNRGTGNAGGVRTYEPLGGQKKHGIQNFS